MKQIRLVKEILSYVGIWQIPIHTLAILSAKSYSTRLVLWREDNSVNNVEKTAKGKRQSSCNDMRNKINVNNNQQLLFACFQ